MWPNHECVIDISEPFSGFVACCVQSNFLHEYVADHWRLGVSHCQTLFLLVELYTNWKYEVVKHMSSSSIMSSTCKGEHSGKEGSVLSLFLMTCKTFSTGMLVNRLSSELSR
jgi:hypothetical protein